MPTTGETSHTEKNESRFPAYGPIEAVLGYLLFYVLVGRVTPTVVTAFGDAVFDLSPSFVRFALAASLWFVLAVTALDQVRRQLAAVGIGAYDGTELRVWSRVSPWTLRTTGYFLAVIAGTAVAVATYPSAIETLLSLISVVTAVDGFAIDLVDVFSLIAFFLAYSVAAHSLDRLAIGAIRALVPE